MKLDVQQQQQLLELANLQRAADHNGAVKPAPTPEQDALDQARQKHSRLQSAAASAQMAVDDMEREILRIQADERKLKKRERDDKRQLSAEIDDERRRDLQHDLYAAKARIGDLMAELKEAHNEIHALRNNVDVHGARLDESQRELEKAERAAQAAEESKAHEPDPQERIDQLRQALPDDVLTEYDNQRFENGVGAAEFKAQKTCGGCFIVLPPADRSAVRNAPAEELPQCPDCGSYLIRPIS